MYIIIRKLLSYEKRGVSTGMGYLEKNDISIFNSIVYQIYSVEEPDEMRLNFLKSVRLLIPYECCNFYLADKDSEHLIKDPVAVDFPLEALSEYLEKIEDEDPTRWIFIQAKSMVYREDDLFSKSAIEKNKCYQEFYIPHNLHHSLQISLALNGVFLGSLSFYRTKTQKPFTDKELFLFDLFKEHLALRLHQETTKKTRSSKADLPAHDLSCYNLTDREIELAKLLTKGLTVQEIGNTLCISSNTVRKHSMNIYKKMNISSRWELFKIMYL